MIPAATRSEARAELRALGYSYDARAHCWVRAEDGAVAEIRRAFVGGPPVPQWTITWTAPPAGQSVATAPLFEDAVGWWGGMMR